jgi:hypothetical protein
VRTEVNQLVWVKGEIIPIYGIPQLKIDVVRMADMAKTPDIRTRACIKEWCCKLTISHILPMITVRSAVNLLAGGGMVAGVGDYRQEKGKGNFGLFELVGADDENWHRIARSGGRAAQIEAMRKPTFYDDESSELLVYYEQEINRRDRRELVDRARMEQEAEDFGEMEVTK